MLEKLDQVDWGNLGHAYGTAEDIPETIRKLLCDDQEEREEAIGWL